MDATCFATDTTVDIYFVESTDNDDFESLVEDKIDEAWEDGSIQVPGLADISGVDAEIQDIEPVESSDNGSGIGAGAIVGVIWASIVVLLFAVFWINRRRKTSFFREIDDGDIIVKDADNETNPTRRVHIFGEEGSFDMELINQNRNADVSESGDVSFETPASISQEEAAPASIQMAVGVQEYSPSLFGISEQKMGNILPSPTRLPSNNERSYQAEDSVYL